MISLFRQIVVRFDIGEKIQELLSVAEDQFEQYKSKRTCTHEFHLLMVNFLQTHTGRVM